MMNIVERRIPTGVLILIAGAIAVGAMIAATLLLSGNHAQATHVDPVLLEGSSNEGKRCSDLQQGQTWVEFKLEGEPPGGNLTAGDHSDGTLTVTISNFTFGDDSFDWTSNIGVDGVVVKDGNAGAHFYLYDPEATGDDGLVTPGEEKAISHISFCYDVEATPTPTATPTATATATPTPTPPPPLGVTQEPEALPDTGDAPAGGSGSYFPLLLALGGLALVGGAGTLAVAAARRRR